MVLWIFSREPHNTQRGVKWHVLGKLSGIRL